MAVFAGLMTNEKGVKSGTLLSGAAIIVSILLSVLGVFSSKANSLDARIEKTNQAYTESVQRISVVEAKIPDVDRRLGSIENKIDLIITKVR